MMGYRVFVSRPIPKDWLSPLLNAQNLEVVIHEDPKSLGEALWSKALKDYDAIVCFVSDRFTRALLQKRGTKLKVLSNFGVGYDNIDVDAASEFGVAVTITPDVLSQTTAEMAWALLFAVSRRIVEGDRMVRSGKFEGFDPTLLLGREIAGKTLGLLGAGRIATKVAMIGKAFSLNLLYCAPRRNAILEENLQAKRASFEELLARSDFLSLHVPLTDTTKGLIDSKALNLMKPGAILINTARGEVVDEEALAQALHSGKIAGAGLDVFEREPEVSSSLKVLENVVLTPHIGSSSLEARQRMGFLASQNVLEVLSGELPKTCVNALALSS